MTSTSAIWSFLVAALLGFLIGLERERKRETRGSIFAGIRTFPLIALFGAVSGQLGAVTGALVLPLAFFALALLLALAYWRESAGEKVGGTTQVAALVAFGLGVLAGLGSFAVALAGAVLTTGVLSLRDELHTLAGALSREDLFALVQFAAVSLIILPLVPDATYGPWGVWNPRTIWLLVVLISAVSFIGYVAVKLVGSRRGIGLSGLLGGLASSTAVTLSFSAQSKHQPALGRVLAVGVLAASAVAAPRLLVLLGVVQPQLILAALVPLGTLFVVTTAAGLLLLLRQSDRGVQDPGLSNPFELRSALQFALLFALVLLLARAAEVYLGDRGVYLAGALAGVTQLDAIVLSLAQQVGQGLDPTVASRGLALAIASNSLFKIGLALGIGSRTFSRPLVLTLLATAVACVVVTWLVKLPGL